MQRDLDIKINNDNKMELTRHGNYSFPVALYHDHLRRSILGYINWHWHKELQFCCVTKGQVKFRTENNEYILKNGEGIFINSCRLHMSESYECSDGAYICLNFAPQMLSIFTASIFDEKYTEPYISERAKNIIIFYEKIKWQKKILELINNVFEIFYNKNIFAPEYKILICLIEIWVLMLENEVNFKNSGNEPKQSSNVIRNILEYISRNYSSKIAIKDISEAVSFSGSECCRIFKKKLGKTIFNYLMEYRIEKSMDLLRHTSQSISSIAYETGFSTTSYYIKCFKELTGITPSKVRAG